MEQLGEEPEGGAPAIQFDPVKVKSVEKSVSELRQSMAAPPTIDHAAPGAARVSSEPVKSVTSYLLWNRTDNVSLCR